MWQNIRPLYEEALLKKAYKLADEARRQKADMYIGKERRAACLAAGLLADEAKRRCGYGDCPVRFTQQGQPYLEIPEGRKKAWMQYFPFRGLCGMCRWILPGRS